MKLQISLNDGTNFNPDLDDETLRSIDRVIVETEKNKWYLGTVMDNERTIKLDRGDTLTVHLRAWRIDIKTPHDTKGHTLAAAMVMVAERRRDESPSGRTLSDAVARRTVQKGL